MDLDTAFGQTLRELRKERGLSQEALALEAGIERNYVSLLERGMNSASMRITFKLCAVLSIAPSTFVKRIEAQLRETN